MELPSVYIMTNRPQGKIYINSALDLLSRVWQHKNDLIDGYTNKHQLHILVWYEHCSSIGAAKAKTRKLQKKSKLEIIKMIEETNPEWQDLFTEIGV